MKTWMMLGVCERKQSRMEIRTAGRMGGRWYDNFDKKIALPAKVNSGSIH